jgi:hypothetical protein
MIEMNIIMKKNLLGVLFLTIIFIAESTWADTTIVFRETGDKGTTKEDQILYISNGKVRIEITREKDTYIIFDNYIEFSEEAIDKIAITMTDTQKQAMAQMKERFKDLPPETQEQMRNMMENVMKRSQSTGTRQEPIRYIPLRQTLTVNGYSCKIIEAHKGKNKVSELCVVDIKKLGVAKEDYDHLKDFQLFMKKMASRMSPGMQNRYNLDFGYSKQEQIPVQVVRFKNDGSTIRYQLKTISNKSVSGDKFRVPADYRERALRLSR